MKFIDLFNNILNEEKENRNKYLNEILSLQTRNIFEKYFKLSFLLENETNKQDEAHWKGELLSGMLSALVPSKEIIQPQIIENIFIKNFDGDFLKSKKILFPKYNELYNVLEYIKNKDEIKRQYFTFIKKLSAFFSSNYKIEKLQGDELYNKQKENIINFINNNF